MPKSTTSTASNSSNSPLSDIDRIVGLVERTNDDIRRLRKENAKLKEEINQIRQNKEFKAQILDLIKQMLNGATTGALAVLIVETWLSELLKTLKIEKTQVPWVKVVAIGALGPILDRTANLFWKGTYLGISSSYNYINNCVWGDNIGTKPDEHVASENHVSNGQGSLVGSTTVDMDSPIEGMPTETTITTPSNIEKVGIFSKGKNQNSPTNIPSLRSYGACSSNE